jgi:hypothetical protein
MDKKYSEISKITIELLKITLKLTNCIKQKCETFKNKTIKDGIELASKLNKLTKISNKNKKQYETIFKEHYQKQTVIDYQKCVYKNCKDIYFTLISVFLNLFEALSVSFEDLIEHKKLKKILSKKTKTYNDLIKSNEYFLILNMYLKNN